MTAHEIGTLQEVERRIRALGAHPARALAQPDWTRFGNSLGIEIKTFQLYAARHQLRKELEIAGGVTAVWRRLFPDAALELETRYGPPPSKVSKKSSPAARQASVHSGYHPSNSTWASQPVFVQPELFSVSPQAYNQAGIFDPNRQTWGSQSYGNYGVSGVWPNVYPQFHSQQQHSPVRTPQSYSIPADSRSPFDAVPPTSDGNHPNQNLSTTTARSRTPTPRGIYEWRAEASGRNSGVSPQCSFAREAEAAPRGSNNARDSDSESSSYEDDVIDHVVVVVGEACMTEQNYGTFCKKRHCIYMPMNPSNSRLLNSGNAVNRVVQSLEDGTLAAFLKKHHEELS